MSTETEITNNQNVTTQAPLFNKEYTELAYGILNTLIQLRFDNIIKKNKINIKGCEIKFKIHPTTECFSITFNKYLRIELYGLYIPYNTQLLLNIPFLKKSKYIEICEVTESCEINYTLSERSIKHIRSYLDKIKHIIQEEFSINANDIKGNKTDTNNMFSTYIAESIETSLIQTKR